MTKVTPVVIFLSALSSALPFATVGHAQEIKWYEVDLIVFSHSAPAKDTEQWPVDPGAPSLDGSAELMPRTDVPPAQTRGTLPVIFEKLTGEALQLGDIEKKLEESGDYKVMIHTGWLQPVDQSENGTSVYLDDSEADYVYQEPAPVMPPMVPLEENPGAPLSSENAPADLIGGGAIGLDPHAADVSLDMQSAAETEYPSTDTFPTEPPLHIPEGPPQNRVYGTATLTMGRFLHLALDLVYRAPEETVAEENSASAGPVADDEPLPQASTPDVPALFIKNDPQITVGYRLQEARRVRTGVYYYFDHPSFGVIAQLLPVDAPIVDGQPDRR